MSEHKPKVLRKPSKRLSNLFASPQLTRYDLGTPTEPTRLEPVWVTADGRFWIDMEPRRATSEDIDLSRRFRVTDSVANRDCAFQFTMTVRPFTIVYSLTEARIAIGEYLTRGQWVWPEWYEKLDFRSRTLARNSAYGTELTRHTRTDEARGILAGREIASDVLPGDWEGVLDREQQELIDRGRKQVARAAWLVAKAKR